MGDEDLYVHALPPKVSRVRVKMNSILTSRPTG